MGVVGFRSQGDPQDLVIDITQATFGDSFLLDLHISCENDSLLKPVDNFKDQSHLQCFLL